MNELVKLEEKIDKLINMINELRQKMQDLQEANSRLAEKEQEAKKRVDGLIDKIDSMTI